MQEYQQRVVQEKAELDQKMDKLNEFLFGERIVSLDLKNKELLTRQAAIMRQYSDILAERIAAF